MNSERHRDIITALIFLLLGIGAILFIIPSGVKVPSTVKIATLSPDFWPRIIASGTIAASLFLLIETALMPQPQVDEDEAEEIAKYQFANLPATLRIFVLVAALFAFYASLTTMGVVAASMILIFAMMLFFGERKLWLAALLSVAVPALLYLFFRYVASVPIPLGIFEN
ncbi:tripartite tricarboxylate transporter TctB family protein [Phaeobacter sp. C3_T13_0]|uniref:tripartite tricarboxylate transporter TctB family protein n=1 Tax=Phaeobacter cretensis TaxID=3342641 RepID=UPI0039BD033C